MFLTEINTPKARRESDHAMKDDDIKWNLDAKIKSRESKHHRPWKHRRWMCLPRSFTVRPLERNCLRASRVVLLKLIFKNPLINFGSHPVPLAFPCQREKWSSLAWVIRYSDSIYQSTTCHLSTPPNEPHQQWVEEAPHLGAYNGAIFNVCLSVCKFSLPPERALIKFSTLAIQKR